MIALLGGDVSSFAPHTGATGPVLESATVAAVTTNAGGGVMSVYVPLSPPSCRDRWIF